MSSRWNLILHALGEIQDLRVREHVPLDKHTSFRLGGPARIWTDPLTVEALAETLAVVASQDLPWVVLGGGTNVLFADDAGYSGIVISSCALKAIHIQDGTLLAEAGVPLARLVTKTIRAGLAGFAEFSGIPGTVGGAIAGNAGVPDHTVFSHLHRVSLITPDGHRSWIGKERLHHGYRRCSLPEWSVIAQAEWLLPASPPRHLRDIARAAILYRTKTQPLGSPSAGSIFKNPAGESAGSLLERAGLKGARSGGAIISPVHANWIVLDGPATALDVIRLIDLARHRVRDAFGIDLETEIRIITTSGRPTC